MSKREWQDALWEQVKQEAAWDTEPGDRLGHSRRMREIILESFFGRLPASIMPVDSTRN